MRLSKWNTQTIYKNKEFNPFRRKKIAESVTDPISRNQPK